MYSMPHSPEIGTWYVVVTCQNCKSTIRLFRDLTGGKSSLDARYLVTCPQCKQEGEYKAEHYQQPAEDN
jgi:hypothetical protein